MENLILGKIDNIKVVRPHPAAIPLFEGIHLQVTDSSIPWYARDIRSLLHLFYYALPVAKAIVEGKYNTDFWTNIHLNSYPSFDTGVNVYGRDPTAIASWARPVVIRPAPREALSQEVVRDFKLFFINRLPMWKAMEDSVVLFQDGIVSFSPDESVYKDELLLFAKHNEHVIWVTERNVVVIVGNPHVLGLHLVVHVRQGYWDKKLGKFWQVPDDLLTLDHVTGFLEEAALLLCLRKLLWDTGNLFYYNPEIHFSGNWGFSLAPLTDIILNFLKPAISQESGKSVWGISTHGHLYATNTKDRFVTLPKRPFAEDPKLWEGITPLSDKEVKKITQVVRGNLASYVQKYAQGGIG